jgi:hypothetical protein
MTLCGSLRSRDWACVGKMVSEKESQRDLRFGDPLGTEFGGFVDRVEVRTLEHSWSSQSWVSELCVRRDDSLEI